MIQIIVGCIVVKNKSFVMVQEAQTKCRGKWNLPLGHLDEGESIVDGAIRESQEETGLTLNPKGFVGVYQNIHPQGDSVIKIILEAEPEDGELRWPENEILDAKWIKFEEFKDFPIKDIRAADIATAIEDYITRGSSPLENVRVLDSKAPKSN
jgi:ADP-ribose pyrophosphatase YjhB (NUDIX family)